MDQRKFMEGWIRGSLWKVGSKELKEESGIKGSREKRV